MNDNFLNLVGNILDKQTKDFYNDVIDNDKLNEYIKFFIKKRNVMNVIMINMYGKLIIKNIIKTLRILTQYQFSPFTIYDMEKGENIDYKQINFNYKLDYKFNLMSDSITIDLFIIPLINNIEYDKSFRIELFFCAESKFQYKEKRSPLNVHYSANGNMKGNDILLREIKKSLHEFDKYITFSKFSISTAVYLKIHNYENIPKKFQNRYGFKRCSRESEWYKNVLFLSIPNLFDCNLNINDYNDNLNCYDTNFIRSLERGLKTKNNVTNTCFNKLLVYLLSDRLNALNDYSMIETKDYKYSFHCVKFKNNHNIKNLIKNINNFKTRYEKFHKYL